MYHERKLKLSGRMQAVLRKPDGRTEIFEQNNLIVDVGVDLIADALGKPSGRPNVISHIAVGTDNTAVDAGDTALGTELDRNAATYAHTAGASTLTMAATFAAGEATGNLTEAGIFNAASSGSMLNRVVFTAIPKEASDELDITFTITLTPS